MVVKRPEITGRPDFTDPDSKNIIPLPVTSENTKRMEYMIVVDIFRKKCLGKKFVPVWFIFVIFGE